METIDIIKSIDLKTLDKIDPAKLSFGTEQQDCGLIVSTFERGAHTTPTEEAVFATMSRSLQNIKGFSGAAVSSMNGYLRQPAEQANKSVEDANTLVGDLAQNGTQSNNDQNLQGISVGDSKFPTLGEAFGKDLMDFAKNCIPCIARIQMLIEMHPNINLLAALEADILAKLGFLTDLMGMLRNFDIYGDFCQFIGLFSGMCIPDLQRIIAMLMSLLIFESIKLDGMIGLLQMLIAPIFKPILMAITTLLDQFSLVVMSPIDCIIAALNEQARKFKSQTLKNATKPLEAASGAIKEVNQAIVDAKNLIKEKLAFYIGQITKLLGEVRIGDGAYLKLSLRKLTIVRLVSFLIGIIASIARGQSVCSNSEQPPENNEINNFLDNFLNPNNSYNLFVDENGDVRIDEKLDDFIAAVNPTGSGSVGSAESNDTSQEPLSFFGNVVQFEATDLVDSSKANQINQIFQGLTSPVPTVKTCKFKTSVSEADKINQWISELNSL